MVCHYAVGFCSRLRRKFYLAHKVVPSNWLQLVARCLICSGFTLGFTEAKRLVSCLVGLQLAPHYPVNVQERAAILAALS